MNTEKKPPAPQLVIGLLIAASIVLLLVTMFATPRDDTDPTAYGKRSGLNLLIDYGTGCMYLRAGSFGNITPRLDPEGKPFCDEGLRK
jgi:hypothetical protein